jgi:RNA polymerase sigma-70 factor (ECF subfamily)
LAREHILEIETAQARDLELAQKARNGDEQAFEEIVRRYTPRVFHIAGKFFRQRSVVEEVSQEVFMRAYTQLASYEGRGSLEGWITRITTNMCLNLLRKQGSTRELSLADLSEAEALWVETRLSDSPLDKDSPIERGVVAADLAERILSTLPPDDRLVLMLLDGEELTVRQIAEMTGWSESKIKVKALRARRKMRTVVQRLLAKGR